MLSETAVTPTANMGITNPLSPREVSKLTVSSTEILNIFFGLLWMSLAKTAKGKTLYCNLLSLQGE